MKLKPNFKKTNNFFAIILVFIALFLIVLQPVRQFVFSNDENVKISENKFVPNDPTWYEMGDETLYIQGYTPYSDLFIGDNFDYETATKSFTYKDSDGEHKPEKDQIYQNWFKYVMGDRGGFGAGGNEHDALFTLSLENPEINEVGVNYYVEEIKFNTFDLFWQFGKIKQITLNDSEVVGGVMDWLEVPQLIEKIKKLFEALINIWSINWPDKPEWWHEGDVIFGYTVPEWPDEAPEWLHDLPGMIADFITVAMNGALGDLAFQIAGAIAAEVIWKFAILIPPPFGEMLAIFHELFSIGVVWENKGGGIESIYGTDGHFVESNNVYNEDGVVHIKPTTYDNEDLVWEKIYTFDNNAFHEDAGHKNDNPISLEYSWRNKEEEVNFRLRGMNDFKTIIGVGGDWNFLNAIELNFDEKVVYDDSYYSFNNDVFGDYNSQNEYYRESQENFFNANYTNGKQYFLPKDKLGNERPYFTKENTYYDLEEYILKNKIIVSRDRVEEISQEDLEVEFLDENGIEIDKGESINSSKVNLILKSTSENFEVSGESIPLTYEIPFINFNELSITENVFDYNSFTNQPFDNVSSLSWSYDDVNKIWNLNTNEMLSAKFSYYDGVREIGIVYEDSTTDFNLTPEDPITNNISIPYKQIVANETNDNYNASVHLVDAGSLSFDQYEGVNFNVNYNSTPNKTNIKLFENEVELKTSIKTIDLNKNSKYILPNEIYDSVTTSEKIIAKSNYSINVYELVDGKWMYSNSSNEVEIDEDGIWGLSTIDEWGNNNFILVEKTKEESVLKNWEKTDEYIRDEKYFLEQESATEEIWNSYSSAEYREVNLLINSECIKNIENGLIKNPLRTDKLSLVTNGFENGKTAFDEEQTYEHENISLKDALEREINTQMNLRGFEQKEYSIVWDNVTDSELISNELGYLKFTIKPKGYWNSLGEVSYHINLFEYQSLSYFVPDIITLENSTNKFSSGTKFNEQVLNFNGVETSIKKTLEEELKKELVAYGIDSEYINDVTFEWNISDEEAVNYDDDLSFEITSNAPLVKGTYIGFIESKTKIDLSKYYIDTTKLTSVTNQYFNGAVFGADYSDYGVEGNIKDDLTNEIINQLNSQGITDEQVFVEFYDETDNVISDYQTIDNEMEIKFVVTSKSPKFFGTIEETFEVKTFDSLDMLYIPTEKLMAITNQFESGVDFRLVKNEMENFLEGYLLKKGLTTEYIDISWNYKDDYSLNCKDLITLEIKSNNFDYIRGSFNGTFAAIPYFDLAKFKLDTNPIQEIILSNTDEIFGDVLPQIILEIESQLTEQGYDISLINITWNIGNEETIKPNTIIKMEISGISEILVHGSLNYSFETEGKVIPVKDGKNVTFLIILSLIILGAIIIAISAFIIKDKMRKRRDE